MPDTPQPLHDEFLLGALTASIYIYETGCERFARDACPGKPAEYLEQKEQDWIFSPQRAIAKLTPAELRTLTVVMQRRHRSQAAWLLSELRRDAGNRTYPQGKTGERDGRVA